MVNTKEVDRVHGAFRNKDRGGSMFSPARGTASVFGKLAHENLDMQILGLAAGHAGDCHSSASKIHTFAVRNQDCYDIRPDCGEITLVALISYHRPHDGSPPWTKPNSPQRNQ